MASYEGVFSNATSTITQVKNLYSGFNLTQAAVNSLNYLTTYQYRNALADGIQNEFFLNKTVVDTISLIAPAYDKQLGYNSTTKQYETATIPSQKIVLTTVLVDVSQARNVVITPIAGLNGTVKEFISEDDYELSIRGALVNHIDNTSPTGEAKLLASILSCPEPLQIVSDYLQTVFSISNVVCMSKEFPMEEGQANTIYYNFVCRSDFPVEIHGFKLK